MIIRARTGKRRLSSLFAFVCIVFFQFPLLAACAPKVERLDPPNWFAGFARPVMLLAYGDHLEGTSVSTNYPNARVTKVQAGSDGRYLFIWLDVASAQPGSVPLRITAPSGAVTTNLRLYPRHSASDASPGVSSEDVIYLIMPDRFADGDTGNDRPSGSTGMYDRTQPKAYHGGDLRGIRDHLDYLHDLGVTTLWLTPVWKNTDSDYHGYHVVDFYAIDDHMGTLRDYQDLVADAHKLGMKVLIDYVVNHVGPRHPWASLPPAPNWFHGTPQKHLDAVYKFDGLVDPHASAWESRATLEGWFANKLPDLNPDNPLVAQYVLDNALWWMETAGLDAFRLDTFPYSSRRFWSGWNQGIFQQYPHTATIGEVWDMDPTITSFFVGERTQFDGVDTHLSTVFDFPLYGALRDVLVRDQSVQKIVDVLERDWLYPHPERLVTFIGNHDSRRFMGEEGASLEKLKAAFSLLLTMRGIPQIYYGDEIAMAGGDDPDNRHDFPGGFPGDAPNAFTDAGRTPEQQDVFTHLKSLLRLRREHPALRRGEQRHIAWSKDYYAFLRADTSERLLVVFNNAAQKRTLTLNLADTPLGNIGKLEPLGTAQPARLGNGVVEVRVPARSVVIYSVE